MAVLPLASVQRGKNHIHIGEDIQIQNRPNRRDVHRLDRMSGAAKPLGHRPARHEGNFPFGRVPAHQHRDIHRPSP